MGCGYRNRVGVDRDVRNLGVIANRVGVGFLGVIVDVVALAVRMIRKCRLGGRLL